MEPIYVCDEVGNNYLLKHICNDKEDSNTICILELIHPSNYIPGIGAKIFVNDNIYNNIWVYEIIGVYSIIGVSIICKIDFICSNNGLEQQLSASLNIFNNIPCWDIVKNLCIDKLNNYDMCKMILNNNNFIYVTIKINVLDNSFIIKLPSKEDFNYFENKKIFSVINIISNDVLLTEEGNIMYKRWLDLMKLSSNNEDLYIDSSSTDNSTISSSNDYPTENDFIENNVVENNVVENNVVENVLENNVVENDVIENNVLENDVVENNVVENDVIENVVENDVVENNVVENDVIENVVENEVIENDVVENNVVENDVIENDVIENDVVEENVIDDSIFNYFDDNTTIEDNSLKTEKKNNKNNKKKKVKKVKNIIKNIPKNDDKIMEIYSKFEYFYDKHVIDDTLEKSDAYKYYIDLATSFKEIIFNNSIENILEIIYDKFLEKFPKFMIKDKSNTFTLYNILYNDIDEEENEEKEDDVNNLKNNSFSLCELENKNKELLSLNDRNDDLILIKSIAPFKDYFGNVFNDISPNKKKLLLIYFTISSIEEFYDIIPSILFQNEKNEFVKSGFLKESKVTIFHMSYLFGMFRVFIYERLKILDNNYEQKYIDENLIKLLYQYFSTFIIHNDINKIMIVKNEIFSHNLKILQYHIRFLFPKFILGEDPPNDRINTVQLFRDRFILKCRIITSNLLKDICKEQYYIINSFMSSFLFRCLYNKDLDMPNTILHIEDSIFVKTFEKNIKNEFAKFLKNLTDIDNSKN